MTNCKKQVRTFFLVLSILPTTVFALSSSEIMEHLEKTRGGSTSKAPFGFICWTPPSGLLDCRKKDTWQAEILAEQLKKERAEKERLNAQIASDTPAPAKPQPAPAPNPNEVWFKSQNLDSRKSIQEVLSNQGLYTSTIDGFWGAGTARAIASYTQSKSLSSLEQASTENLNSKTQAAAAKKLRIEDEARLEAERDARAKIEAEIRAEIEAEEIAKREAEAEAQAKAQAEAEMRERIEAEIRAEMMAKEEARQRTALSIEAERAEDERVAAERTEDKRKTAMPRNRLDELIKR